jgi:hypothetical protein
MNSETTLKLIDVVNDIDIKNRRGNGTQNDKNKSGKQSFSKDYEENVASLKFYHYKELSDSIRGISGCCPEPSIAENDQIILMTWNNKWMSYSKDGGRTFMVHDATTIFPRADDGFCCDQIIHYVESIDMFVWLYQTWKTSDGNNRVRLAAATTDDVISSNGKSKWTYWDFPNTLIGTAGTFLDFNDISFGDNSLYFNTNSVGRGRIIARLPLQQIKNRSTIHFSYSPELPNCNFSRISKNTSDEAYWGGHKDNSTLRVYSWKEGSGTIFWRFPKVNSWPNIPPYTAICPDGKNWVNNNSQGFAWYGATRHDNKLWIAWPASSGGSFPQTHIRLAQINLSNYSVISQHQIWNSDFAFNYPSIDVNSNGEVGISLGFGGNSTLYGSHGVGVWGDYTIYTPKFSDICTERWGDYTTLRRANNNSAQWIAGGYTNQKDTSGNLEVVPHYIRFGR